MLQIVTPRSSFPHERQTPVIPGVFFLFLGAFIVTCSAWGPEGHMTIGLIAEYFLIPLAKQQVQVILQGERLSDNDVANWPDIIRGNKTHEQIYPGNAKWHYVNFDVATPAAELRLPADGNDVVDQVVFWQKELANQDNSEQRRCDALRFLGHFVGDLHQPLHCTFRDEYRGGNLVPVHSFRGEYFTVNAETTIDRLPNLHSTWDESLVYETMGGESVSNFAAQLLKNITADRVSQWDEGDPYQWALQTHGLAVTNAYRFTDGSPIPKTWKRPGIDLTRSNYIDANLPVVREQLQRAGVRLAHLINATLGASALRENRMTSSALRNPPWIASRRKASKLTP